MKLKVSYPSVKYPRATDPQDIGVGPLEIAWVSPLPTGEINKPP